MTTRACHIPGMERVFSRRRCQPHRIAACALSKPRSVRSCQGRCVVGRRVDVWGSVRAGLLYSFAVVPSAFTRWAGASHGNLGGALIRGLIDLEESRRVGANRYLQVSVPGRCQATKDVRKSLPVPVPLCAVRHAHEARRGAVRDGAQVVRA